MASNVPIGASRRPQPRLTGMIPTVSDDRRKVFFRLIQELAEASTELEAARSIAQATDELYPWDAFNLDSYDGATNSVIPLLTVDVVDGVRQEVPPANLSCPPSPLAREVIASGARLILRSPEDAGDLGATAFGDKARRSASLMFAPVRNLEQVVGILSVQSYRPNAYTEEDLDALQALASLCAGALGRVHAKKAASRANELIRLLAENTDDLVSLISVEGERLYISPSYYRLTGWTPEEVAHTDWRVRSHPDEVPMVEEIIRSVMAGRTMTYEVRVRRSDGTFLWLEQRSKPLCDPDGRVRQILTTSRDITARKAAEQALRESESRLQAICESAPLGIYVTNAAGDCTFTNPEYQRISGFTLEQSLGTGWRDSIHPEDRERVFRGWYESIPGKQYVSCHRFLRPDGTVVPTEVHAAEIRAGDQILGYVGTVQDITERNRAEQELAEREERYRLLFQLSPHGILLERGDGTILEVNDALCRETGYSREELVGSNISRFVPEDEARQVRENLDRLAGGETLTHEVVNIRKDGSRRLVALREAPMPLPCGAMGALVLAEDVTELRRTSAALRESEERFRAFMENSPAIAWIKDEQGRHVFLNAAFERRFNAQSAHWVGKTDHEVWPAPLADTFRATDLKVLASGETLEMLEGIANPDGGQSEWLTFKFLLRDAAGRRYVAGISTDVTERRQLQREILEISDRERTRIGQDLHDSICQQLIGIAYGVNHIARTIERDAAKAAAEAARLADALDAAITQTREIARGLYPAALQTDSFATVLRDLAGQAGRRFNLAVELDLDESLSPSDPTTTSHLFRIAQEAMTNVGRHARARRLSVGWRSDAGRAVLEVVDDGDGLGPDPSRKGTMGLRIMKYRADVIGAELTLSAPGPGAQPGTRVVCRLPLPAK